MSTHRHPEFPYRGGLDGLGRGFDRLSGDLGRMDDGVFRRLGGGGERDNALLQRSPGSRYWYTGGVRLTSVLSWLAGILAGASCTSLTLSDHLTLSGPLAGSWVGRNDLGWLVAG